MAPTPGGTGTTPAPLGSSPAPTGGPGTVPPSVASSLPPPPTYAGKLRATVELVPPCVSPGGTMTLTVTTAPDTGVGFTTVYAGGAYASGLAGAYTGSGAGYADAKGVYRSSWQLTADTPTGRARVDAHVRKGDDTGGASKEFTVAGPGQC